MTHVYTDGSCIGNPGPGGWAWAMDAEHCDSGMTPGTTNNRMEIQAVIEAVKAVSGRLVIHSDSRYVVDCFLNKWHEGWLRRGWTNSQRKPVANRDLWEELLALVADRDITFEWVRGHNGDAMNSLVDRMARAQAEDGAGIPAWCGTCGSERDIDLDATTEPAEATR